MGVVKREEPFFCLFGLKELYYHAENNGMQRLVHNAVLLLNIPAPLFAKWRTGCVFDPGLSPFL